MMIDIYLPRRASFPYILLKCCRIGNKSKWFILPKFSEWGQFVKMKDGCIIPVIRIY